MKNMRFLWWILIMTFARITTPIQINTLDLLLDIQINTHTYY